MMGGGMMAADGPVAAMTASMMKRRWRRHDEQMGGGGMMGGGMMGGGMMGGGMGQTESAGNYWKTEEKKVMIRAFDFTVPARHQLSLSRSHRRLQPQSTSARTSTRGVDTKTKRLRGPWSEATDEVHMPPDVMPYAIGTDPPTPSADMKVKFQVIRFRPADGVTVTRNFSAGPGEVIGEPGTAEIPSSDGSKHQDQHDRLQQPSDRARSHRQQENRRVSAATIRDGRASDRTAGARRSCCARWVRRRSIARRTTS